MDIVSKTNGLLNNDHEMSLTIKYLLENPILLHPPQNNNDGKS